MHSTIGTRNPLHSTAIGKAILAFLPLEERTTLLDRMILTRRTSNTITDKAVLVEHLDSVHAQGFAIDDIEEEEGLRCVGAPIFNHSRRAIAAVSISGPAYRLSIARLEELSKLVRKTAEVISIKLGHIPGQDS
jgi:DNA-binding IclR family transcriptional regulator